MSLVTVEEFKRSHLIESGAIAGDFSAPEQQQFLDQAQSYFESRCYQTIGVTSEVEQLPVGGMWCAVNRHGGLEIMPTFFPIISVSDIRWRIDPGQDWATEAAAFNASDYSVQLGRMRRIIVPFANPFARHQFGEVQVTYQAGYATVPQDVKYANILLAGFFMSAGYAVVDIDDNTARAIIPSWAWKVILETVKKYKRYQ